MVLLPKTKLDTIEDSIFKTLIISYINHDELFSKKEENSL